MLIVAPEGGEVTYPTLWAAAGDAHSGDVIELRYDGRREERPIMLGNLRLTIRGGEGFAPQVVFRPSPDDLDPSKYPRSMLTVTGGELSLVNVDVQLEVPRSVEVESWSLIETRGAKLVRLERCSLTVRNAADDGSAYHAGVAFFNVKAPPGSQSIMIEEFGIRQRPVTIRLEHCVVRGEATFLLSSQSQPITFFWDNGLLVISDRFLTMHGGNRSSPVRGLQIGRAVQMELRHLTAVVLGGLLSTTTTPDAPYQMHVEIQCSDSIIVADGRAALVEQRGVRTAGEFMELLTWNGAHNFYEGFRDFLTIRDASGDELERLDFRGWQDHWTVRPDDHEDRPRQNTVVWNRPGSLDRPLHDHTVDDYTLGDRLTDQPARGGASDGRDAGLRAELLPTPAGAGD